VRWSHILDMVSEECWRAPYNQSTTDAEKATEDKLAGALELLEQLLKEPTSENRKYCNTAMPK
jgi:uncharacterized protein (DUF2164 family)